MTVATYQTPVVHLTTDAPAPGATALTLVSAAALSDWLEQQSADQRHWVEANGFTGKPASALRLLPEDGKAPTHIVGWNERENLDTLGALPYALPPGAYTPTQSWSELALLGWVLGAYKFSRYTTSDRAAATLHVTPSAAVTRTLAIAESVYLCRDLINTPAADMLPSDLAAATERVAERHGASLSQTCGDELLEAGYRTIHAVGRAASDAPRLIDLQWGDPEAPKVTLVGKGICFDSGGLDIKPSSAMRTMKKDMGGAAQALALADLIMAQKLPIRLRLLIAAAENAISGNAFRPGDVITTYSGRTVEIDNTDAEGRLVLCDALSLATEESPELIVDFATLTGSARSAVGTEISAMFANRDDIAEAIAAAGEAVDDPVWRMPLHQSYRVMLKSNVADMVNSAPSPFAGAITAALYLEAFVDQQTWVHFDLMAYNTRNRPARPEGGEAMAMRAVFGALEARYAAGNTA